MRSQWILIGQSFPKKIRTIEDKIIPSRGGRNPCVCVRGFAAGFGQLAVNELITKRSTKQQKKTLEQHFLKDLRAMCKNPSQSELKQQTQSNKCCISQLCTESFSLIIIFGLGRGVVIYTFKQAGMRN